MTEAHWVAIAFLAFIFLAFRPVSKLVAAALDKRSAKIQENLDEAIKLREEAESLLSAVQGKAKEAEKLVSDIIHKAREEARILAVEAEKEIEAEINKKISQANQKIARAEAIALEGVRERAVELAINAAKILLKENMNEELSDKIVQDSLTSISRKLH